MGQNLDGHRHDFSTEINRDLYTIIILTLLLIYALKNNGFKIGKI